jgi:hypothetical protein
MLRAMPADLLKLNSTEHFARRKHAKVASVAQHQCKYTASQTAIWRLAAGMPR